MMKNVKSDEIIKIFFTCFKNVFSSLNCRSMFGGYGICQQDIMFALVYDDRLYLRASKELQEIFFQHKMEPLILLNNNRPKLLQYYEVTEQLWSELEQLEKLLIASFSYAVQEKQKKKEQLRLKDNPNISLHLEKLLNNALIMSIEELCAEGAVNVYYRLKKNSKNLSINVLYALEATIHGCHAAVLPQSRKDALHVELSSLKTEST